MALPCFANGAETCVLGPLIHEWPRSELLANKTEDRVDYLAGSTGFASQQFFGQISTQRRDETEILAVILGGSAIYDNAPKANQGEVRDWDGCLIVSRKNDIPKLINRERQRLKTILNIVHEECEALAVPVPDGEYYELFDCVRFAGWTEEGQKKSVKILSLESFRNRTRRFNILSHKDRRIYSASSADGCQRYCLQQATRITKDLLLVHDHWIFEGAAAVCQHGVSKVDTAFGVTADLLMTGIWVYDPWTTGEYVRQNLAHDFEETSGSSLRATCFAKSSRFSDGYLAWLAEELRKAASSNSMQDRCDCLPDVGYALYGATTNVPSRVEQDLKDRIRTIPPALAQSLSTAEIDPLPAAAEGFFSSNSTSYPVKVTPLSGQCAPFTAFQKTAAYKDAERKGAENAKEFYPITQEAVALPEDSRLFYAYFKGRTEADYRMSFYRGSEAVKADVDLILYTELRKAEDMLRAYRNSLKASAKVTPCSSLVSEEHPGIHRFFHDRLRCYKRLEEFYARGIVVHGENISLWDFIRVPLCINGKPFPSVQELHDSAEESVHRRHDDSRPVAFGLGDAHGANVMVDSNKRSDNSLDILYIDYEVAGWHSPLLDLAKPFYNDVFFETFFASEIGKPSGLQCTISDSVLDIRISTRMDDLSKMILEIKKRYLIEPLLQVARDLGPEYDLEPYIAQLGGALFACAVLTRNYSGKWDDFLANLAIGAVLSQIENLDDLWRCCTFLSSGSKADETPAE